MSARTKPLKVVQPIILESAIKAIKYYLPQTKPVCKYIDSENVDELIRLLHEEAKVI
jgi:electron transfer flavoprotein beta subunit